GLTESGSGGHHHCSTTVNTPQHVMRVRHYIHRVLGDFDMCKLIELVVHARQLLLDVVGALLRGDVDQDASMLRATSLGDLAHDRLRHHVAGEELGWPTILLAIALHPRVGFRFRLGEITLEHLGHVAEHEPLALGVLEDAAFAAHAFGHDNA